LIIHYTAKILYAVLDWGVDPQQAIDLPNFAALNGPTLLEKNRFAPAFVEALSARGHEVRELELTSGLQVIGKLPGAYAGGADARREGVVLGD
jgi:gamma-glutamyltranspeptidase/glutathione hydrolase